MSDKDIIRGIVQDRAEKIASINSEIWGYAEAGYHEEKSAAKLISELESEGFKVTKGIAGIPTAFVAEAGSGKPVIGITAEYDSLPGLSQEKGLNAKKPVTENGYGHGCGHCTLSAGSAGAAMALKKWLEETGLPGTVKLFGTPAEEFGFGKVFMAREGCFDDLDAVFTWHPGDSNSVSSFRMTGNFKASFRFTGVTAHAAGAPHMGRSALDACELMNVGVNYLREHVPTSVRMHYAYLDCGGEAPNVVQDHAELLYMVRAPKLELAKEVLDRVENVAKGAALMTGTEMEMTILGGMCDVIPNETLSKVLTEAIMEAGGPEFTEEEYAIARSFLDIVPENEKKKIIENGAKLNGITEEAYALRPLNTAVTGFNPGMRNVTISASSDVGDVSYKVPVAQINAACAIPGTGVHTWQMTAQVGTSIGEKAAQAVAVILSLAASKVVRDPSLAEKAKAELLAETGGKYPCPLPDGITPEMIR